MDKGNLLEGRRSACNMEKGLGMRDKYVQCPFYQNEQRFGIVCEGLTDYALHVLRFPNGQDKADWMECVCCVPEYENLCPYAAALQEIYESGGMGFIRAARERKIRAIRKRNANRGFIGGDPRANRRPGTLRSGKNLGGREWI